MTCFMRHLGELFEELDLEQTTENKRKMQKELWRITGIESKKCWDIWKEVKIWLADDEKKALMIKQLKEAVR